MQYLDELITQVRHQNRVVSYTDLCELRTLVTALEQHNLRLRTQNKALGDVVTAARLTTDSRLYDGSQG